MKKLLIALLMGCGGSLSAAQIVTTIQCLEEHNLANLPVASMDDSQFNQLIECTCTTSNLEPVSPQSGS
jgi:hypothetical protein